MDVLEEFNHEVAVEIPASDTLRKLAHHLGFGEIHITVQDGKVVLLTYVVKVKPEMGH